VRICFYAAGPKSGLDNNGGSRTIVRSATALRGLGHDVSICASHDEYTWDDHPPVVKDPPPDRDVLVSVSARDVKNARKLSGKLVWWVRGKETWQMSEADLIKRAKMCDRVIANAEHLQRWLVAYDVDCDLCYAGMDLNFWQDFGLTRRNIGGLKIERHNAETKRGDLVKELCNIYATGKQSQKGMRDIYNDCEIWLSPSENEGFHQCPAEAALCGALVVGYVRPSGGTRDWLDDTTGHLFSTVEEAREAIREPDFSRVEKAKKVIREKIGPRDHNMKRFIELCQFR
jgi:hypothetical protein